MKMIQWVMNAPKWIVKLEGLKKRKVLFSLQHKEANTGNTVEDITKQMTLRNVTSNQENVALEFEQEITINIPKSANFIEQGDKMILAYKTAQNQTIIITLTRVHFRQPTTIRVPLINERKDHKGNITKLIIDIPPENISKQQLETLSFLLKEIMSEWHRISLAKRTAGTLTWVHKGLQFVDLVVLELPGESFLQCVGNVKGSTIRIDVPTDFVVHVPQKRISFEFNSIQYELTSS